mmetsp:Transcript_1696/g.5957  ORF Transcript_1696/g.5957 Transcript_1696/m.5957 type:complete len:209 (+) Transcript_1696:2454-3080(+)
MRINASRICRTTLRRVLGVSRSSHPTNEGAIEVLLDIRRHLEEQGCKERPQVPARRLRWARSGPIGEVAGTARLRIGQARLIDVLGSGGKACGNDLHPARCHCFSQQAFQGALWARECHHTHLADGSPRLGRRERGTSNVQTTFCLQKHRKICEDGSHQDFSCSLLLPYHTSAPRICLSPQILSCGCCRQESHSHVGRHTDGGNRVPT